MKRYAFKKIAVVYLVVITLLLQCGSSTAAKPPESKIIGKWMSVKFNTGEGIWVPEYAQVFLGNCEAEFFNDTTVLFKNSNYQRDKGGWTILEDGRIKINIGKSFIFGILQGDTLKLDFPDEPRLSLILKKIDLEYY
jgi:hypothetical protein